MRIVRSRGWLGFLWLAFVGVLSLLPLTVKRDLHTTGVLHPWGHVLAFAITAVLFYRPRTRLSAKTLTMLVLILFGVLLEFLQHTIYAGGFELSDVRMDAVGVFLGVAIASVASRGRGSRSGTTAF